MLICFVMASAFLVVGFLPSLPSIFLAPSLLLIVLVSLWASRGVFRLCLVCLVCFLLSASWAISWGHWQLQNRLALRHEGVDLWLEGQVVGLPVDAGRAQRFVFEVEAAQDDSGLVEVGVPARLRLSWYRHSPVLAGERWRLQVRLKRPHGFVNPGGFDYERWLLSRSIGATGYVRKSDENQRLSPSWHIDSVRGILRSKIIAGVDDTRNAAVLVALALGDQSLLEHDARQLIRVSGLSHLLAISGLHVGLAAAAGFVFGRLLGSVLALLSSLLPIRFGARPVFAPRVSVYCALLFAATYAALAGFSIPTQRALVMLSVWSLWTLLGRRYSPWLSWWVSMVVVLWLQPLAFWDVGFWLSFMAVAVLMMALMAPASGLGRRLGQILLAQFYLFVGLGAAQVFLGLGVSVLSPLLNLVAIPYISLLVVPCVLLAVLLLLLSGLLSGLLPEWLSGWLILPPWWAEGLLQLASGLLDGFWWLLSVCHTLAQNLGVAELLLPRIAPSALSLLVLLPGVWLMIAPVAWLTRALALITIIAVLLPRPILAPSLRVSVLDVGQGLSVLVRTGNEALLYDTGPRFSAHFDAGAAVVVPFLRQRGLVRLNKVVVSHGDSDHSGGVQSLAKAVPVSQWWLGEILATPLNGELKYCSQDREWFQGGTRLQLLGYVVEGAEGNNRSCVLLVTQGGFRLLLPGDIESEAERQLLSHPALQEPVDVLLAPHHGSVTSSTAKFVAQLQPRWVIFSAGYRSRYGHPHAQVVERYRRQGAQLLNTADCGAITIEPQLAGALDVGCYRQQVPRYWR